MKNKKGLFNFVFGLLGFFVLIMIIVVLMPIQMNIADVENVTAILDNTTSSTIQRFDTNESLSPVINIAYSFIHFMLYASFEVVKEGVSYAVENPSFVNAKTLLWIILISLLTPIIYYVFMLCVVIFLLIREWVLIRREKKKMKEMIKNERI